MARYLGPKVKLSRRVGVPIADIPKHTSKRQLNPPGQHGFRGRRPKDYGIRKDEKQKLRYHYNVMEKQFRRYVDEATRRPGNTGELLLQLLECRQHEHCCLTHTRFGLAEHIHTKDSLGDALALHCGITTHSHSGHTRLGLVRHGSLALPRILSWPAQPPRVRLGSTTSTDPTSSLSEGRA